MRCRPGDLAVIVNCRPFPQYVGRLVEVVSRYAYPAVADWLVRPLFHAPIAANVYGFPIATKPGELLGMADMQLRPIRPSEGPDETLTWAPVPASEVVGANAASHRRNGAPARAVSHTP